jgi:putative membrane protein
MPIEPKSSNEIVGERTDLAILRTVMAADRSLMAWVRAGLSMTSIGFTVYKLLQAFQESGGLLPRTSTPRTIGLFLTGLGTAALVMGTIEYFQTLKDLRELHAERIWRPAFILATLMTCCSVFMFVSIISRLL